MHVRRLVVVAITATRRRAAVDAAEKRLAAHRESLGHMIVAAMAMVERNARSIARRLPPHIDKRDLVEAGHLALVQAAANFDASRGVTLDAYARRKVRGAMWETVRRRNWREMSHFQLPDERNAASKGGTTSGRDGYGASEQGVAGIDCITDQSNPESEFERNQRRGVAIAAMDCLDERERFVVERYYDGDDLASIGAAIGGIHRKRVSDIHTGALRKMREYFALRGIEAA